MCIIGSWRASASAEPPEQGVPYKMRRLRGLRTVGNLRKSTADCSTVMGNLPKLPIFPLRPPCPSLFRYGCLSRRSFLAKADAV